MKVYLVGGYVRDRLLGRDLSLSDKDYVVVGATPQELIKKNYRQVGKNFPVFIHPETKDEYALARKEMKTGHGYKEFDFIFTPDITLEEDLKRRDFTINAIAVDKQGHVFDPYNGRLDLEKKVIRHISKHFTEDPLRVLRAARFASVFNFEIVEETQELIIEIVKSGELKYLSHERIFMELRKCLVRGQIKTFVHYLNAWSCFQELFGKPLKSFDTLIYPQELSLSKKEALFFINLDSEALSRYKVSKSTKNLVEKARALHCGFFNNIFNTNPSESYQLLRSLGFLKINNEKVIDSILEVYEIYYKNSSGVDWLRSLLITARVEVSNKNMGELKGRDYANELASRYITFISRFSKSKPLK